MKDTETLAIMQGIYKAVGAAVSTKDADSLRSQVDARLIDDYNDDGTDSRALLVNGIRVGKISISTSRPSSKVCVQVDDYDKLIAWLADKPTLASSIIAAGMKHLEKYVADTGEIPDGCSATTVEDKGGRVIGTRLTGCKPDDVAKALGNKLPETIAGLLGA